MKENGKMINEMVRKFIDRFITLSIFVIIVFDVKNPCYFFFCTSPPVILLFSLILLINMISQGRVNLFPMRLDIPTQVHGRMD